MYKKVQIESVQSMGKEKEKEKTGKSSSIVGR